MRVRSQLIVTPLPPEVPRRRIRRTAGASRRERGAVLVEAALVTPLLLLLVFGLFEMGMLFRDYLGVTASVKDGARAASIAANDPQADWHILQAVKRTSQAIPDGGVKKIVVFNASLAPNASGPSTACLAGTAHECNVYTPADWDTYDSDKFECDGGVDPNWCGKDRSSSFSDPSPALIGVYIEVEHAYITGMFGDSITLEEIAIFKIEPTDR